MRHTWHTRIREWRISTKKCSFDRIMFSSCLFKWAQFPHSWCVCTLHALKQRIRAYFPVKSMQIIFKSHNTHKTYHNERKSSQKAEKKCSFQIPCSIVWYSMPENAKHSCKPPSWCSRLYELHEVFCHGEAFRFSLHEHPCHISEQSKASTGRKRLRVKYTAAYVCYTYYTVNSSVWQYSAYSAIARSSFSSMP